MDLSTGLGRRDADLIGFTESRTNEPWKGDLPTKCVNNGGTGASVLGLLGGLRTQGFRTLFVNAARNTVRVTMAVLRH